MGEAEEGWVSAETERGASAAASVKPPQPRKEEIQPLSRDQVRVFLETVEGDRMEALYVLAVTAGLRRGELLALKWKDVDLDGEYPTLQVRRSLSETRGRRSFEAPKKSAVVGGISGSLGGP
jgi:integrase